ncbi:MAG: hypothetical protein M1837_000251 [Sclerophora amabilis]|nr:MAG: hypothetical protein M1837_000251 [Sclerophora amabilis]
MQEENAPNHRLEAHTSSNSVSTECLPKEELYCPRKMDRINTRPSIYQAGMPGSLKDGKARNLSAPTSQIKWDTSERWSQRFCGSLGGQSKATHDNPRAPERRRTTTRQGCLSGQFLGTTAHSPRNLDSRHAPERETREGRTFVSFGSRKRRSSKSDAEDQDAWNSDTSSSTLLASPSPPRVKSACHKNPSTAMDVCEILHSTVMRLDNLEFASAESQAHQRTRLLKEVLAAFEREFEGIAMAGGNPVSPVEKVQHDPVKAASLTEGAEHVPNGVEVASFKERGEDCPARVDPRSLEEGVESSSPQVKAVRFDDELVECHSPQSPLSDPLSLEDSDGGYSPQTPCINSASLHYGGVDYSSQSPLSDALSLDESETDYSPQSPRVNSASPRYGGADYSSQSPLSDALSLDESETDYSPKSLLSDPSSLYHSETDYSPQSPRVNSACAQDGDADYSPQPLQFNPGHLNERVECRSLRLDPGSDVIARQDEPPRFDPPSRNGSVASLLALTRLHWMRKRQHILMSEEDDDLPQFCPESSPREGDEDYHHESRFNPVTPVNEERYNMTLLNSGTDLARSWSTQDEQSSPRPRPRPRPRKRRRLSASLPFYL